MLQDPNVERYVEQAMKPVLKQIKELKAEVELLKKALRKTDVSSSATVQTCKECGVFVFTADGKMCMNGHCC